MYGLTWSYPTIPDTSMRFREITYGKGLFITCSIVASDYSKRMMYSYDGLSWEYGTCNSDTNKLWSSVTYGNNRFVTVCPFKRVNNSFDHIYAMTSTNGINWSPRYIDFSDYEISVYGYNDYSISNIIYALNNFIFVAWVGSTLVLVFYSSNGDTWNNVEIKGSNFSTVSVITFLNGTLYLDLGAGGAYISNDIITWEYLEVLTNTYVRPVYNGEFYLIPYYDGTRKYAKSYDFVNWSVFSYPEDGLLRITYNNGLFIALFSSVSSTIKGYGYGSVDGETWFKIDGQISIDCVGVWVNNKYYAVSPYWMYSPYSDSNVYILDPNVSRRKSVTWLP